MYILPHDFQDQELVAFIQKILFYSILDSNWPALSFAIASYHVTDILNEEGALGSSCSRPELYSHLINIVVKIWWDQKINEIISQLFLFLL